jgi:hypothetical protein
MLYMSENSFCPIATLDSNGPAGVRSVGRSAGDSGGRPNIEIKGIGIEFQQSRDVDDK